MNETRRDRAKETLEFYKYAQLRESGPIGGDDFVDLLTDLRHLCGPSKMFGSYLVLSEVHYNEEKEEEEDEC